jgi:hypothetical protein
MPSPAAAVPGGRRIPRRVLAAVTAPVPGALRLTQLAAACGHGRVSLPGPEPYPVHTRLGAACPFSLRRQS